MFNHASFIWGAADILRGAYKQHEYGDVILPFTVLFRLDAVLAPTKAAVLDAIGGGGGMKMWSRLLGCCGTGQVMGTASTTALNMISARCRGIRTIWRRTSGTT